MIFEESKKQIIPLYIFSCLEKYGNTIVTKKTIKKIGGKEVFINELKKKGFIVKLKDPNYFEEKNVKTVYDHFVVELN